MPEIEFTVECEFAGHGELETEWGKPDYRGVQLLYVTPCEKCTDENYDRGREEAEND